MARVTARSLTAVLLSFLSGSTLAAGANFKNFETALYVRVYEVQRMKDPAWFEPRWSALSQKVKFDKVYLETHRDGIVADAATIGALRKFFESRGLRTAGGIALTMNERNFFETYCYSKPDHRQKVKDVAELTARLFDEFILDDFFFTDCKCEECIRAKGNRSWTRFRLEQMEDVARNLIVGPARAVNPKVKITLKYPNWYDHFQYLGYNLEAGPKIFDKIYTGTETRDPDSTNQHLQQYHGYSIFRYLENIKPGGNAGGWVDPAASFYMDRYGEQLWLTLFAKAPEITLFDFRQLVQPLQRDDGSMMPDTMLAGVAETVFEQVDSFLGKLGKPIGVKSYKPYHSSGEDYLHSYIGMLGIPMDLVPDFPTGAPTIFLTESAKFDSALADKIKRQLVDGKTVVITSGLLAALQGKGIEDIAELEVTGRKISANKFTSRFEVHRAEKEILFPQIRYATNDAWETVHAVTDAIGYPILLRASYAKGALYVLTIPDDVGDLYSLPAPVLNQFRQVIAKDLPVQLEGPSRVSLIVYANDSFIVASFLPRFTSVRIVAPKRMSRLRDLVSGAELEGRLAPPAFTFPGAAPAGEGKVVFDVPVRPHSYRVFSAR